MTLWQLKACVIGYNVSQGVEPPLNPLSVEEYEADMRKAGYH